MIRKSWFDFIHSKQVVRDVTNREEQLASL